ncbi:FAS1 domain-containing protein [Lipomyces arxii]|uniref:FAS1 domain-containing protein n=1 Tax=Lipomyces arxii TaxID=56418 RepID=UPI0034CFDC21
MMIISVVNSICLLIALLASPALASVSIVDLLSSSGEFTSLIRALQRTGLIPVLNMGRNITFFAPTNKVLDSLPSDIPDLPELLQYLIITDPIVSTDLKESESVYFSHYKSPASPGTPLAMNVELLRAADGEPMNAVGNRLVLGYGAANVIRHDWMADNGVIHVIDNIVPIPNTLCPSISLASQYGPTRLFSQLILRHPMICYLLNRAQDTATLLVPLDSAFLLLNDVELAYLLSEAGHDDRLRFLGAHFLYSNVYRQNDTTGQGTYVPSMSGEPVKLRAVSDGILVNDVITTVEHDVIFQNGVIHVVPSLLKPRTFFQFTPRKYLYGLNATTFADELLFHDFSAYVDDTHTMQTIFAPVDTTGGDIPLSLHGLMYHFVEGNYLDFDHSTTLQSKLQLPALNGHKQHISITVHGNGNILINDMSRVVSAPVKVGNTVIIPIDRAFSLPPVLKEALGSVFGAHKTFDLFESLGLFADHAIQGATLLVPDDDAWAKLGSVGKYLTSSPKLLQTLFYHLMLTEPLYSSSFGQDAVTYQTVAGTTISIAATENKDSLLLDGDVAQSIVSLTSPDVLYEGGVLHGLSSLPMPKSITVTARDLLDVEDVNTFVDLLEWVSLAETVLADDRQYIILAPADAVMSLANVTYDTLNLSSLLGLHVFKRQNVFSSSFFEGSGVYDSIVPGFHASIVSTVDENLYMLRIVSNPGIESLQPIRVLSSGVTTSGSEVYVIDRVLPALTILPHIRLPGGYFQSHGVLVALGAAVGIIGFFMIGGFWFWIIHHDSSRRFSRQFKQRWIQSGADNKKKSFSSSFANNGRSVIVSGEEGEFLEDDESEIDRRQSITEETPFLQRAADGLGSRVDGEAIDEADADAEEVELLPPGAPEL